MRVTRKPALAIAAGTLLLSLAAGVALYAFCASLSSDEQAVLSRMLEEHGVPLFLGTLAIVVAFVLILQYLASAYLMPAIKLAEDTRIVHTVNSAPSSAEICAGWPPVICACPLLLSQAS